MTSMELDSKAVGDARRAYLLPFYHRLPDSDLLERFLSARDDIAFEVLVSRHADMVYRACRRVLHNDHDAEDAFQATFLVLVRKAASICPRDQVGNWLYGVAVRTALEARRRLAQRQASEQQMGEGHDPAQPQLETPEWRDDFDRELLQLPDKYRNPVLLCDLEGRTHRQAAQELGVPEGTLSVRLSRGRKILAQRLTRRGVRLGLVALSTLLFAGAAAASTPFGWVANAVHLPSGLQPVSSAVFPFPVQSEWLSGAVRKPVWTCQGQTETLWIGNPSPGADPHQPGACGGRVACTHKRVGIHPDTRHWQGSNLVRREGPALHREGEEAFVLVGYHFSEEGGTSPAFLF